METNFKRYWDDIRKTLFIYSLVPILALFLIGYPLQYHLFVSSIQSSNQTCNESLAADLETSLGQQLDMVQTIARDGGIQAFLASSHREDVQTSGLYETIYRQMNQCDLRSNCFVLDRDGKICLSTISHVPGYLAPDSFPYTNLARHMAQSPEETVVEWSGLTQKRDYGMYLGQAVMEEGQIAGFVVAVLSGDTLSQVMAQQENSALHSVAVNPFGYPFTDNVEPWQLEHGKLHPALRQGEGKVKLDGRTQYVSSQEILEGRAAVYTMTDVGYLDEIFLREGAMLLILCTGISLLLLAASRRIARKKSDVLDQMIVAIQNVRKGNLHDRLLVDTGDEFQIFAEEYNRMLTELEKLMELNKEIGRRTAISEIKQLESQFNPHFLFNTLSSIRYMIEIDPKQAQQMMAALCKILRYSIKTLDSQTTLAEDWQYTQQYLSILKSRFGQRLFCKTQITPEAMDCLVPKLLLQPIIENAVTYGFGQTEVLHLEIQAAVEAGLLSMTITNDGDPIDPERLGQIRDRLAGLDTTGRSIGLYNIHRRIQLMYGSGYGVTIASTEQTGTVVKIAFPARRGDENDSHCDCGR